MSSTIGAVLLTVSLTTGVSEADKPALPQLGRYLLVNAAETIGQVLPPLAIDRAVVDDRDPPAFVVDHAEASGDGAGVDAEDAHKK